MAYHILPAALESLRRPLSGAEAFVSTLAHALRGHVPMERLHVAGLAVESQRKGLEARIVAAMEDALSRDLNPIVRCFLGAASVEGALTVHRGIHALSALTTKTELAVENGAMVVKRRVGAPGMEDIAPCRDAHLAAMDFILRRAALAESMRADAKGGAAPIHDVKVSDVAEHCGLRFTAAGDAAIAFEADPTLGVDEAARQLGCQARTLQRELKAMGATAGLIRQVAMLNGAIVLLRSSRSLTDIAHQAGYADQAHMTRAFVSSCGLPPSLLRKAFA